MGFLGNEGSLQLVLYVQLLLLLLLIHPTTVCILWVGVCYRGVKFVDNLIGCKSFAS